jgi:hypothetical protein
VIEIGQTDTQRPESDLLTLEPGPAPELPPVDGPEQPPRRPGWLARAGMRLIRRPYTWATRPWPDDRIIRTAATFVTLVVTTWVMMNVLHWNPFSPAADLINDDTTPTGGDMGAHVWGPAFLRDHLLPNWQLSGWSMDWYGGLPVYRFYMVIPALMIVALDTVLPYGVAFKYVVVAGGVSLPIVCWAFGRLARFRYPMPELFAFGALCFLFNESIGNHLLGGNVLATFAGEFSFSLALSFMVLGWGLLARGLEDGKYRSWAAIVLALACLCHGIVLIYTVIGAVAIVGCRLAADVWNARRGGDPGRSPVLSRRATYALAVGLLTMLLSAFWVGPFLFNHDYMTDMHYGPRPQRSVYTGDSFWQMFFDQHVALDVVITTLAVIGVVGCVIRRHLYGIALTLTTLAAVALVYLSRDSLPGIGLLWNPRVLPLFILGRYILMMVGAAEVGWAFVNFVRNRRARDVPTAGGSTLVLMSGAGVVLLVFGWLFQALPFDGYVTKHGEAQYAWGPFYAPDPQRDGWMRSDGWPAYNFKGYEGRGDNYNEYYGIVQTMAAIGEDDDLGCGRALWEDHPDSKPYGTKMALMLLPFWTDGCIASMEGLFFEASGSTPYHFLTAGAMTLKGSTPVRYVRNDAEVGVEYAQALGVRYVMLRTPEAIDQAEDQAELTEIAQSGPWRVYLLADTTIVEPLDVQPVVVDLPDGDGRERFLELGTSWFQNQDDWAAMPATDGPDDWQHIDVAVDTSQEQENRVSVVEPEQEIEPVELDPIEVTNVDITQQSVEFDVSEPGVPVLVRVSYFPNWNVEGAEGPYRIGPNQMVVVPTDTHVKLSYGRSKSDVGFYALTLIGLAGAVFLRRRGDVTFAALSSPEAAAPPPDPDATPSSIDPIWEDDASARRELPPPPQGGPVGPDASLPALPDVPALDPPPDQTPTPSPD